MTDVDPRWYDGFFEREYLDWLALPRDPEQTAREVDFLVEKLGTEPGARVLDLACGRGRHSLELARRGLRVTGVDLSPRSLELARADAAADGLEVAFVQADMRELDFVGAFDAAISVFTSLGYFESDEEDRDVLVRVARALRPGGRFLVDVINPLGLARLYQPRLWDEVGDGILMVQEHEWDVMAGRNRAVWTFVRPDGSRSELSHVVRMYAPSELVRLVEGAGLRVLDAWGGFDGTPLTYESRRQILLAST